MRRVDEAIRQVVSDALTGELKDPRVGFVTVTDVSTSPDLRHARVYFSVLSNDGRPSSLRERDESQSGLESAHGFLQALISEELHLKRTPELRFIYDETTDRAMRVGELLEREGRE